MPAYESIEEYLNSTQIGRQIIRIRENVSDALTAIGAKGVTVPSGATSDDLADLISAIQTGGGTPSATQHTILFEFEDETTSTITAYYDSAFISSAITATTPTTYDSKTVDSASLDGVAWYTRPTETWETLFNGNAQVNNDTPYNAFWISALSNVYITMGSVWRVTLNGNAYRCTVTYQGNFGPEIGNPLYSGGQDDGSGVPFDLFNAGWGAWSGGVDLAPGQHPLKIERLVTS